MKFPAADRAHVYHEFAKLLGAGFGVDKACGSLIAHRAKPVVKGFAGDVRDGVERGLTVADAVGASQIDVGAMEVRLIEAGEKAGRLADAFEDLSGYYETVVKTRREVVKRLLYPLVLVHAGCLLPAVPAAVAGGGLPAFLKTAGPLLLAVYALGGIGYLTWRVLSARAATDPGADALLAKLPAVGGARRALALSRFCHVLGIFLLAGQRTSEAVAAAGEASGSGQLFAAGNRLAETARSGSPVGPEMLDEPAIALDVSRRLASAEEVGGLEKECEKCAALQRAEAAEGMERAARYFSAAVYVFAMGLVVYQILTTFIETRIKPIRTLLDSM